nr:MAG: ZBED8-like protein [Metapenaeopsis lamellata majanivirus]
MSQFNIASSSPYHNHQYEQEQKKQQEQKQQEQQQTINEQLLLQNNNEQQFDINNDHNYHQLDIQENVEIVSRIKKRKGTNFNRSLRDIKKRQTNLINILKDDDNDNNALLASYIISFLITREKRSYTIANDLILPCIKGITSIYMFPEICTDIESMSLSNDEIHCRVKKMSYDIKSQILDEVKKSGMFNIRLHESTDVPNCSYLFCFISYVHKKVWKEEFLFCKSLDKNETNTNVIKIIKGFFLDNELDWNNIYGICTDDVSTLLGFNSNFFYEMKKIAPNVVPIHCIFNRNSFAMRTLPKEISDVIHDIVLTVNFIKQDIGFSQKIFKKLDDDHQTLLYYTKNRWLTKGNIIKLIFQSRGEILSYLKFHNNQDLLKRWEMKDFEIFLAYLADLFNTVKELNKILHEDTVSVIETVYIIQIFRHDLKMLYRKYNKGNLELKNTLKLEHINDKTWDLIQLHYKQLKDGLEKYILYIQTPNYWIAKNPFNIDKIHMNNLDSNTLVELAQIKHDDNIKKQFNNTNPKDFWPSNENEGCYPNIYKNALRGLFLFSSSRLCEEAFIYTLHNKMINKNKYAIKHNLRCALNKTMPRFSKLVLKTYSNEYDKKKSEILKNIYLSKEKYKTK